MANTCVNHLQLLSRLTGELGTLSAKGSGKTNVPVLTLPDGSTVSGYLCVSKYLARKSTKVKSLYSDKVGKACQIDQWLEYLVTYLDRCCQERDVHTALQELNAFLRDRVYFVGGVVSIADILIYYCLLRTMKDMTFYDKERYINLSRWFNNVQQDTRISEGLNRVNFQRNFLYGRH